MNKLMKTSILSLVVFSFSMLQATAWYEQEVTPGDGGWVNFNGNNVPSNYNDFLNNNSMTTIVLDDGVSVGGEGDFLGAFYGR